MDLVNPDTQEQEQQQSSITDGGLFNTVYANVTTLLRKSTAVELTWKDLKVKSRAGDVTLLSELSGTVVGRFLAVMGPSGSGKTTFLNTLSLRAEGVAVKNGRARIGGQDYDHRDIKELSGYVMQEDVLFERMTAFEVLMFAAEMKMHPSCTMADRRRRVNKVLKLLDLTPCRDVIVGGPLLKGLSGGQRKRLTVAVELITRPPIFFLDEPTSGLDSVNALALVQTLRNLALNEKVTVVATIHQPSTRMFELFDDLLLLERGQVMYHGPASQVVQTFAAKGYPCPPMMNPAEWILEVVMSPEGRSGIVSASAISSIQSMWESQSMPLVNSTNSDLNTTTTTDIEEGLAEPPLRPTKRRRISWLRQFWVLFLRASKLTLRDRFLLVTQVIQTILMSLLVGGVFFQVPSNVESTGFKRAALFFCTVNQGIFGALMTINNFPAERKVIVRERLAGMYPCSAYFIAKCASEVVFQCAYPLLFSCVVYWMIGLRPTASAFFTFLGFMELCVFASNSVALLISPVASNVLMASAVLPLAIEIARLFGGFFMPPIKLPIYFVWLDAISYVKYVYMAITMNEFQGAPLTCSTNSSSCINGDVVLQQLGIDYIPIYACALVLIGLIVVLRGFTYLALRIKG